MIAVCERDDELQTLFVLRTDAEAFIVADALPWWQEPASQLGPAEYYRYPLVIYRRSFATLEAAAEQLKAAYPWFELSAPA